LTFSIDHCILIKEKEKVTKTDILEVINNHYIMCSIKFGEQAVGVNKLSSIMKTMGS
jgi:hypothetical protein